VSLATALPLCCLGAQAESAALVFRFRAATAWPAVPGLRQASRPGLPPLSRSLADDKHREALACDTLRSALFNNKQPAEEQNSCTFSTLMCAAR